jgi:hypothetical protein
MPIAKSPEGKRLIDTYCVKGVQVMDIPEADRELFIEYCKQDVEVERMIGKVLRELDDDELRDYLLNEIINDRGLPIDTEFALAAQRYGEQVKRDANAKIRALTGGMVEKATSRKMRTVWLRERLTDEEFEIIEGSFDEHHRAELAAVPGLHPDVQRFIELVEDAGGATMAKYANIFNRTIDNRLNGAFLFSGAGQTGRYCIAEDSAICVLRDGAVIDIPIQQLLITDLVWDGEAFVEHEGLVFSGYKEVIEHDGIRATPDHHVFTQTHGKIPLALAKAYGDAIQVSDRPCGDKVQLGRAAMPDEYYEAFTRSIAVCLRGHAREKDQHGGV